MRSPSTKYLLYYQIKLRLSICIKLSQAERCRLTIHSRVFLYFILMRCFPPFHPHKCAPFGTQGSGGSGDWRGECCRGVAVSGWLLIKEDRGLFQVGGKKDIRKATPQLSSPCEEWSSWRGICKVILLSLLTLVVRSNNEWNHYKKNCLFDLCGIY